MKVIASAAVAVVSPVKVTTFVFAAATTVSTPAMLARFNVAASFVEAMSMISKPPDWRNSAEVSVALAPPLIVWLPTLSLIVSVPSPP